MTSDRVFVLTLVVLLCATAPHNRAACAQSWFSTEGPHSGEVTAAAATADGVILAGTAGKGLFYRRASESVWTRSGADAFDGITVKSIVAVNDHLFAATAGKGIWRSVDGGDNWGALNSGLGSLIVHVLKLASDGKLYAGASSGLYRLSNSDQWVELGGGIERHDIRTIAENSEGTLFAGSFGRGVLRSSDEGLSWELFSNGLATTIIRSLAVNADDEIFVGTFGGNVVQRSDDRGETWVASGEGLAAQGIWTISIAPDGTFLAGARSEGIFTSPDGRTWTSRPAPHTTVSGFVFTPGRVWAATRVGLLSSSVGGNDWTIEGIPFSRVNTLHRVGGRILAGLHLGGVHYSDDGGTSWIPSALNDQAILRFADDNQGGLLAGTLGSGLYKSTDQGETWSQIWNTTRVVYAVSVAEDDAILAGTDSGVYRLPAGDSTWQLISPPGVPIRSVLTLSDGVLLAGSEHESIWRSDVEGQKWTQVAPELIDSETWIWDLLELPDGRIAAATTGFGVWFSEDAGRTWVPLPGTSDVVAADLALSQNGELMAVGLLGQVFLVQKNADRADTFGPPFLSTLVRSLAAMPDGTVFIGTEPLGVQRLDGLRIVSTEHLPEIPAGGGLEVYPNPANRLSGIQVRFEEPGPVQWEVVDLLGRRLGFGEYTGVTGNSVQFQVDVSHLSPGLYWIRVRGERLDQSRSVVVVR